MSTTSGDLSVIDSWWREALRQPEQLPTPLEPVQTRLIRAVARGTLPDGGSVFVKLMWFPRGKDRLRYLVRSLPASHEAAMLRYVAGVGVRVPEVVWSRGVRRWGLPRLSMLVTQALDCVDAPFEPAPAVRVVGALLDAGVYHPDLNSGNFLRLRDGGVGLVDLQSVRRLSGPVSPVARREMLAKMLSDVLGVGGGSDCWEQAMVDQGICTAEECPGLWSAAARVGRRAVLGRIRRCLQESTLFAVRRGLLGTLYRRRNCPEGGDWVEGGAELFRYWLGDRGLEILESWKPLCGALYRPAPWSPGRHRLYLPEGGEGVLTEVAQRLEEGHDSYQQLLRAVG